MDSRKTLHLLFIVAGIFAIIILVWYFFLRPSTSTPNINDPTNPQSTSTVSLFGSNFIFNNNDNQQTTQTEVVPPEEAVLLKVWDKPTAGFVFTEQTVLVNSTTTKLINGTSTEVIVQNKATSTRMLFVDKLTGYIYGYDLGNYKTYQVTNTTLPGIYDAYFLNNGTEVVMRYLDNTNSITTLLADVPSVSENGSPSPLSNKTYLPKNITSLALNDTSTKLAYLISTTYGGNLYVLSNRESTLVYSSPLSEFDVSFGGNNIYTNTKPSAYITGYLLDTKTGEQVISNRTGLNSLPSGDQVNYLFSMWTNKGLGTFVFSKKTGIQSLGVNTLAEKCIWSKSSTNIICAVPNQIHVRKNGLPDDWYMGLNQFTDDLYFINTKNLNYKNTFYFSSYTKEAIDLIKPKLNRNDSYMGFINKRDYNLWLLKSSSFLN